MLNLAVAVLLCMNKPRENFKYFTTVMLTDKYFKNATEEEKTDLFHRFFKKSFS